jgi:hypothetical protein
MQLNSHFLALNSRIERSFGQSEPNSCLNYHPPQTKRGGGIDKIRHVSYNTLITQSAKKERDYNVSLFVRETTGTAPHGDETRGWKPYGAGTPA